MVENTSLNQWKPAPSRDDKAWAPNAVPVDLNQFLKAQRSYGSEEGEGAFSIDLNAAAKKLRENQLPSLSHYLLKAVQAAVSAGASGVDITREKFRTTVSFVVPNNSALTDIELLTKVLAEPLGTHEKSLGHLVGAIGGALSTRHEHVSYCLEFPQRRLELRLSPEIELHETPAAAKLKEEQCRCTLVRSEKKSFWKALFGLKERGAEARLLSSSCANSPVPIKLDTRSLADTWDPRFYHPENPGLRSEKYSAFAHYIRGESHLLGQTLPTKSYEERDNIHIWKGALWGVDDAALPQGLATTYGLAFLDESGRIKNLRVSRRMLFSRALILDISLSGPTFFFPVQDGVTLNAIKLDQYPGLSVLGWAPSLSVDLSGFSVVQDAALADFMDSLKPQYQQLVEHTYSIKDLVKRTFDTSEQDQHIYGWGDDFKKEITLLKRKHCPPESKQ